MKNDQDILSSILKTTQMGQVGIRSVMDAAVGAQFKKALHSQLHEYDIIESEAHKLASERGWKLEELNRSVRAMSGMMSRAMLATSQNDSKIAGMMIQGNTRGMIKSIKNLHQYSNQDPTIRTLAQKLLDCEKENIQQMQSFL